MVAVRAKLAGLALAHGTIRTGADDRLWLRVNGKEIAKSAGNCHSPGPVKITLQVGDLICARLLDAAPPNRDFHMRFTADEGAIGFAADGTWRCYQPKDSDRWWVFQPHKDDPHCRVWGKGNKWIWGKGNPAYVYHVVTVQDLTFAGPTIPTEGDDTK